MPDFGSNKTVFSSFKMVLVPSRNKMTQCCDPRIALKETESVGHCRHMNLDAGVAINSDDWTEPPIVDFAIFRVHDLAEADVKPLLVNGFPIFEWVPGVTNEDEPEPAPNPMWGENVLMSGINARAKDVTVRKWSYCSR